MTRNKHTMLSLRADTSDLKAEVVRLKAQLNDTKLGYELRLERIRAKNIELVKRIGKIEHECVRLTRLVRSMSSLRYSKK